MSEEDEVDNRKCIDRCLGVEPGMGLKAMMLNRLMLCIIAVCLLWMTSFGVCKGDHTLIVVGFFGVFLCFGRGKKFNLEPPKKSF